MEELVVKIRWTNWTKLFTVNGLIYPQVLNVAYTLRYSKSA